MVFLMVTLPLCIQGEFTQVIKINLCKVYMFQTLMTCANIAYSVFKHNPDKDKADAVCWLIQGKLA
jgi:hypothetical protein